MLRKSGIPLEVFQDRCGRDPAKSRNAPARKNECQHGKSEPQAGAGPSGRASRPGAGQFHERNGPAKDAQDGKAPSRPFPKRGKGPTRGSRTSRCPVELARPARPSGVLDAESADPVVFSRLDANCRLSHGGQPLIQVAKPRSVVRRSQSRLSLIARNSTTPGRTSILRNRGTAPAGSIPLRCGLHY